MSLKEKALKVIKQEGQIEALGATLIKFNSIAKADIKRFSFSSPDGLLKLYTFKGFNTSYTLSEMPKCVQDRIKSANETCEAIYRSVLEQCLSDMREISSKMSVDVGDD